MIVRKGKREELRETGRQRAQNKGNRKAIKGREGDNQVRRKRERRSI